MKKKALFIMIMISLFACEQTGIQTEPPMAETPRDGVFIHITHNHNNPHRVLMPLQMASMMAADKDVIIYMDIDAVFLVTKDAEDIAYGHFTPLKESIATLLDMGVGIYACPGCMKIAGIDANDLMEGIQVAEKERFFDFTAGKIISLSY